jgi:hypothetical protein
LLAQFLGHNQDFHVSDIDIVGHVAGATIITTL